MTATSNGGGRKPHQPRGIIDQVRDQLHLHTQAMAAAVAKAVDVFDKSSVQPIRDNTVELGRRQNNLREELARLGMEKREELAAMRARINDVYKDAQALSTALMEADEHLMNAIDRWAAYTRTTRRLGLLALLAVAVLAASLVLFPRRAAGQTADTVQLKHGWSLRIDGQLSAGLAGYPQADVVASDVYTQQGDVWTLNPDLVRYNRRIRHSWRPAATGGLLLGVYYNGFGLGVGGDVVLLPGADGGVNPYPAAKLCIGGTQNQLCAGYVFANADDVRLPNGKQEIVLNAAQGPPNFTLSQYASWRFPYFSLVIGMKPFTGR